MPLLTKKGWIEQLISHSENEISRNKPARDKLLKDLDKWRRTFELDDTELKAHLPFSGANAIFLPLLYEETKLLYGKLYQMLFKYRPLLAVTPTGKADINSVFLTEQLQSGLDEVMYQDIQIRKKVVSPLLEGALTGLSVVHIPFKSQMKMFPVGMGDQQTWIPQLSFRGADVEYVPLDHFLWPVEASCIEDARWCMRLIHLTSDQLLEYWAMDMFNQPRRNLDLVLKGTEDISPFIKNITSIEGEEISRSPTIQLADWWGMVKFRGEPLPRMMNLIYHRGTRIALKADYNEYEDQEYPFATWNFLPRPGRLLGMGIGRLISSINEGINEIATQRVNAGRIANTKIFKIRKGSGIKPSQKFYPGMRLTLQNMGDIAEMQMGDVKQSSYADENSLVGWADRVLSAVPYSRGQQDRGAYRPNASGQMALINIANDNIDFIADGLRYFMGRIGRLVYSRNHQYMPEGRIFQGLDLPGGAAIFLPSLSTSQLSFDLASADERVNEEAERQKLSTAYQMYTGYYQTVIGYLQAAENPQMPPMTKQAALDAVGAFTELMRRIGRNLNLKGFEQFLVEVPIAAQGPPSVPRSLPGTQQGPGLFQAGLPNQGALPANAGPSGGV